MKKQTIIILVVLGVVGLMGLAVVGLLGLGLLFWFAADRNETTPAPRPEPSTSYTAPWSEPAPGMADRPEAEQADRAGPLVIAAAQASPPAPPAIASPTKAREPGRGLGTMVFQRVAEPREGAFTMLIPKGWTVEGGIVRVDPTAQGGSAQSIEAKIDMAVKRDPAGTVMSRRLPDIRYFDMRSSPAAPMFPPGSNYNGMTVLPKMGAADFLARIVVPYAHPRAQNMQVIGRRPLPQLAQGLQMQAAAMRVPINFTYDAAMLVIEYDEGGVRFRETLAAAIQDYGQMGAGMWETKETGYFRAPAAEFDKWAPVLSVMANSIQPNHRWLIGELQGQLTRAGIALQTQQEVQRIEQEIVTHRQRTNSEIQNDMFLTLTGQEEYVNPYTKQVERDTSAWQYRWVSPSGDTVYSDQDHYDPNHDTSINRTDFKKTEVRKRFPQ